MIAIGSDHGGYELKEELKKCLEEEGLEYKDYGAFSTDRVDYPLVAKEVSNAVATNECERGILICRSGYGMAMVANKFKGVRSAPCFCTRAAEFSRLHNNTNVLSLGADYVTVDEAKEILKTWLNTESVSYTHLTLPTK